MSGDTPFRCVETPRDKSARSEPESRTAFLADLTGSVLERFHRITGARAVMTPIDLPGATHRNGIPIASQHPACDAAADPAYCRESWRCHLAELAVRPVTHWHKCPHDRFCAILPVVWHRRCLAACHVVCDGSLPEDAFEHHMELFDILIENFVARHTTHLLPLLAMGDDVAEEPQDDASGRGKTKRPTHAQVLKAIEYIELHLSDEDLSAAGIAATLGINSTYLTHLFAEQLGVRMSRYIATRRVELAKRFLATTNWQIKRVAQEIGYSNPDWFCQVFRERTGLTPTAFRTALASE
ncbi:MAG: AraC family transcriptional regulator [Planctomycetota bacterium]